MPWVKGQSGNPAGSKPGSGVGRKPDWLIAKCQAIIEEKELVEFLGKVASGESVEQVVTDQGEALPVPAPVKDRLRATEMLLDRAYGKPGQPVDLTLLAQSELERCHTQDLRDLVAAFTGGTTGPSEARA